jgi:hypothetical protein
MRFLAGSIAALSSLGLLGASQAFAYDIVAIDCDAEPGTCQAAPLSYAAESPNALDLGFDTGWVPSNGPLGVHLAAGVYAITEVELEGSFEASWPDAIVLSAPGKVEGGFFSIKYGAEVVAEARIQISVAGQTIDWTGPIPFVPQFDFVVEDQAPFESWAFDPGVTLSGQTAPAVLAEVGIEQIVGGGIPGLDGGFQLQASIELNATYVTDRLVLLDAVTGAPVAGADITAPGGLSAFEYLGGPAFEVDVHPEGRVIYDGALHLVPAFFVEFLGQDFSIPIADIPIPFSVEEDWEFAPQRVHVPLPDVDIATDAIDFGSGALGSPAAHSRTLQNLGEATLVFEVESSDPEMVQVPDAPIEVAPGESAELALVFSPDIAGVHTRVVTLHSNDPDEPAIELEVVGEATKQTVPPEVATEVPPLTVDGCGCTTAGADERNARSWLFACAALAFLIRRRPTRL